MGIRSYIKAVVIERVAPLKARPELNVKAAQNPIRGLDATSTGFYLRQGGDSLLLFFNAWNQLVPQVEAPSDLVIS